MKKLLILISPLLIWGCYEKGDCSDVSSNIVRVNFFNYSDKKAKIIKIDSIKVSGLNTLFYKKQSASTVDLPLSSLIDSTSFDVYYGSSYITLKVKYQNQSFVLAPNCNAINLMTILDATSTDIELVKIIQSKLSNNVTENIRLYF